MLVWVNYETKHFAVNVFVAAYRRVAGRRGLIHVSCPLRWRKRSWLVSLSELMPVVVNAVRSTSVSNNRILRPPPYAMADYPSFATYRAESSAESAIAHA